VVKQREWKPEKNILNNKYGLSWKMFQFTTSENDHEISTF
jgi:hypothetical protein